MIRNYFKIAWRNLLRNKTFSAINIFGLTVGIASCLLIILYIYNELSYDRYNKKADRIVRVAFQGKMQGGEIREASVMAPVAQTLKSEFPEVLESTRIRPYGKPRITYGNKIFRQDELAFVDSNFFSVFTLPLIMGDEKTALLEPNTIVVTRTVAKKYFGTENPIGKILQLKDLNAAFKVTGLIEKVPENSHFHLDMFASMAGLPESREDSWMSSNFYTYLVLPERYDHKKLEAKLPKIVEKYIGPQLFKAVGLTIGQFKQSGNHLSFFLQPLTSIHLHSDLTGDMHSNGDIRYVYIFSVVAVFMLLIACINFMNLSTAGASKRGKEVGIRKVMGSLKKQLVTQFLIESLLLTVIAFILALVLVYWSLPFFNSITGQNLKPGLITSPWIWQAIVLFVLITGLLAGSYPAFYLSSFKPIAVLKGRFTSGKNSISLRSGLVVFQFFISICLIAGTTVVYQQLSFIRNKKLGYDKNHVLIIHDTYWLGKNQDVYRHELSQHPQVLNVSRSNYLPAGRSDNNNFLVYPENRSSQLIKTLRYEVDEEYIPVMGIEMKSGRNFSTLYGTDSAAAIINETTARAFGWNEDPLGKTISNTTNEGIKKTYQVIGVIKDFHFKSLHESITPLIMVFEKQAPTFIVKVKSDHIAGTLNDLKTKWDGLNAESPFSYSFLNEQYNNMYKTETNIGRILGIFSGLTIFVACLGLLGLAMFTAEQRKKEIGIRKVLGADVPGIVGLLTREFLKFVVIAFCIASPVAWYVMNLWLHDFAYRISINWIVFVVAGSTALLTAFITVSYQAIKAATANPVKNLRSE